MKRCCRCGYAKPRDQFSPDARSADGLASKCRQCSAEYLADYRKKNRDRLRDQASQYYREVILNRPDHTLYSRIAMRELQHGRWKNR